MSQETHTNSDPTATPTLDQVYIAMQHWRKHKNEYPSPGIPDNIWLMIFQLENTGTYSGKEIRRLLTLNSKQYQLKYKKLMQSSEHGDEVEIETCQDAAKLDESTDFCEVFAKPGEQQLVPPLSDATITTKQTLSHLKSTDNELEKYLDLTTVVVECISPDGRRLKIHTTNKSLDIVMQAFFKQGVAA